jgi:hypothetical protein
MPASELRIVDAARERDGGFRCEIGWASRRVLVIAYTGRVPAGDRHLRRTEELALSSLAPVGLCYDLRELGGFHRSQVELHARTLARLAGRVVGIALVGARPAARFGAVTVSLVAGLPLATFDGPAEAIAWLESLREPPSDPGAPTILASLADTARLPHRR